MSSRCHDRSILDQWHPLGCVDGLESEVVCESMLLGEQIRYVVDETGAVDAWSVDGRTTNVLPTITEYGYAWTSLGSPPDVLFEIPEFAEPDRRNLHAASFGIHCSAPRSVENFLDMGHFPFVHTNFLGEEPHTEVREYDVNIDPETNEIWATNCVFWQPQAAASAAGGQMVDYIYRVPHPYCTLLYKSCPADDSRMDIVGLFNQPLTADRINGHMLLSYIDHESPTAAMRRFTQIIFGQDKPILENQYPKCLPLDPRAETPIRADKVAIAYRRWLSELGVTYGVIPAA